MTREEIDKIVGERDAALASRFTEKELSGTDQNVLGICLFARGPRPPSGTVVLPVGGR